MFKSVTFEIIGDERLVCEGCEQRVERLLKAVPGVGQVRAQASNQHIDVLFDTAVLDAAAIGERIGKAGYETRVVSSTSDSALDAGQRGSAAQQLVRDQSTGS